MDVLLALAAHAACTEISDAAKRRGDAARGGTSQNKQQTTQKAL